MRQKTKHLQMMMKNLSCLFVVLLTVFCSVHAGSLDDIRQALERSSLTQVQEKVYIHTDNQCYFVGDTLWYKAYVVRADNLQPTDMSRILYVELLSPDGLLVERQQIIVAPEGYTCGQFCLTDSLYSGYYELRAYTRWMLNFNMRHQHYDAQDTWLFYSREMADDYFRVWDGLYSRVLPVYSKPEQAGDYDVRRMYQRPKTRLPKPKKDNLIVTFYPEGGHLVEGVENRVAFEAVDQEGEAVDISGTVTAEGQSPIAIRTEYMGRGSFLVTPDSRQLKAKFTFRGKQYDISLPKAETQGIALRMEGDRLTIAARNLPQDCQYAVSVLCRGALKHFVELKDIVQGDGTTTFALPLESLPAGIADVTIFDSEGRIWADRLVFVGAGGGLAASGTISSVEPLNPTTTYAPYAPITLMLQLPQPGTFSLSVRDTATDEPTYDDGNIMTDLLLSSELRGFIAHPAHYFESDDAEHRRHLDLLMMVQGWRKYKWEELADTARQMRYTPETTLTIEGSVHKLPSYNEMEPDELRILPYGAAYKSLLGMDEPSTSSERIVSAYVYRSEDSSFVSHWIRDWIRNCDENMGIDHKPIKRDVLIEAEVTVGNQTVGSTQKTQNGRFMFQVPPFYGAGYLNMKAYKENDSIKKNMTSRKDAKVYNEDAYPDFYVKRDLFYPTSTADYSFYQKHQPNFTGEMLIDTLSEFSMENDVHQLQNVNVKGHRRGRRAIDWSKPAFMADAYDLYNDVTDYGLSHGKLNMRLFPLQVGYFLFGNMNRENNYNVDGRIDNYIFYRSYCPVPPPPVSGFTSEGEAAAFQSMLASYGLRRSPRSIFNELKLRRLSDIRVFTDYEPRMADSAIVAGQFSPDVTIELVPFADDAVQPSFRDRHIVLRGINAPEEFYQPDYSRRKPDTPTDYRRTLYWNPNAVTDENGLFSTTFYNNSKETRIKLSAAGVTSDGRLLYY